MAVLHGTKVLWSKLLRVRYGNPSSWRSPWPLKPIAGGVGSLWWRDLGNLEGQNPFKEGWLSNGISRKIGNGELTSFGMSLGRVLYLCHLCSTGYTFYLYQKRRRFHKWENGVMRNDIGGCVGEDTFSFGRNN